MPHRALPQRGTDPQPRAAPDRRSFRRNYLDGNAFEWLIAIAAVIGSITQLLDLDALYAASVGQQVGKPWAIVWDLLYLVGGLLIVAGLWRPWLMVEVAGLCLFFSAVMVNGVAILAVFDTRGVPVCLTYLALATAAVRRGRLVLRIVKRHDEELHGG